VAGLTWYARRRALRVVAATPAPAPLPGRWRRRGA